MSKIVGKKRSEIANECKKQYIKAGKKSNVIKKLNDKVKNSRLNGIRAKEPKDEPESENTTDISTDSDDSEQYIINFSSDSEKDSKKKRYERKKVKKVENSKQDKQMLELQKEIEMLRLAQIKQTKKVERVKNDVKKPDPKPINHKAEAIKKKLLVEF